MASILKNQILKHLSRFVKNLSSDKISLSALKGEGELTNLELEEDVLTELLALPTWMKLTHATCNKAVIRIQWTKLKSTPIILSLDSVIIRVEACEELRQNAATLSNSLPTAGKYGFVNKVIDGITATVNSVEIAFHSHAFEAKVQISRIRVESQSPTWKKVELQKTRLKCMERGETLIFKAMEWQTLRLEARSTSDRTLAPLRLLTNQATAQIVIKKKLSDCQVLGCRLSLILDDLLWVLTDSQILAALHFMSSLSGLIKQATELTQRYKAARKLESLPEYQAQLSQTATKRDIRTDAAKIFDAFDVKETSYHFLCQKIDLHFCDDPGGGRSTHEDLKDGGALQLSLMQVLVDFYPYHLARGDRRCWPKYTDNALSQWLTQSLNSFRIALIEAVSSASMHSPLARTQNHVSSPGGDINPIKNAVTEQFGKLMSTCLILKVQDLRLYKVTTSSKRDVPHPFMSSYIERPKDLQTIHAEFSWFYYPGEVCFPLPSPKIYAHLYPFQIHLDVCTILWLNCFVSNLQNAMSQENTDSTDADYVDVRVEFIMPKVVFENRKPYISQPERPQSVHFQVSRLVVSNYRSAETGSLHQLTQCLELLQRGDLAYGSNFPAEESDVPLIAEKFIKHAEGQDKIRNVTKVNGTSFQEIAPHLTKDMMHTEPRDMWYVFMDPCWADFRVEGKEKRVPPDARSHESQRDSALDSSSAQLFPFVDSLPIAAWIYLSQEESAVSRNVENDRSPAKQKSIKAIFSTTGICNVQLTHYQFLFLMRMVEAFGEMSLYLTRDLEQILGQTIYDNSFTFLGYIPTIEVNLLFTPIIPDKPHSSTLDLESSAIPQLTSEDVDLQTSKENQWKLLEEKEDKLPSFVQENMRLPLASVSISCSPVSHSAPSMDTIRTSFGQANPGLSSPFAHSTQTLYLNKIGGISTPDSEVASQWSNMSSESSENNFVTIETLDEECNARLAAVGEAVADCGVEVASEAVEDNRSTPSPAFPIKQQHVAQKSENDKSVGVLTIRLDNVEVAEDVKGLTSIIKFQGRSISLHECTGMPWSEFQRPKDMQETKFAGRNRNCDSSVTSVLGSPTQKRVIKMRLSQIIDVENFKKVVSSEETKLTAAKLKSTSSPRINLTDLPGAESPIRQGIIDSTDAFLDARIDLRNEEPLVLHMSSVIALTDFIEDEICPSPFPMQIEVIGASIELIEDRPSANITSPGPMPLKFCIPTLLPLSRDKQGVFLIGSRNCELSPVAEYSTSLGLSSKNHNEPLKSAQLEPSKAELDLMIADFEKVQKQLECSQQRNAELEKELQDTQNLKLMVLQLQEQVDKLQDEKSNLLNYLR